MHALAGQPAPADLLTDIPQLMADYYTRRPQADDPAGRVEFGTSGHRGTALRGSFNERHILAISQAICDYRRLQRIDGPLFIGKDTHALSEAAERSAVEVFAANDLFFVVQAGGGFTPTPVISHAILSYNRDRASGLADGVVITPSHNPPADGGFKYNGVNGGPAAAEATAWIEERANRLLADDLRDVRRMPWLRAAAKAEQRDMMRAYVDDLQNVLDMDLIRSAGLKIGADPMGGAGLAYWEPIAETYGLNIQVVNPHADPTFRFMTLDRDGVIRMDCSSPWAMAGLIANKDTFDVAFGNDPDFDRHGIVTRGGGLMQPNAFLAVACDYLFSRRDWAPAAAIGKTLVTSSMIDRVAAALGRGVYETPVGFKWFAPGLFSGELAFGGEESAGASFVRRTGGAWSTDKDGIIMDLLAAEITAARGRDLAELYTDLTERHGAPLYERLDAPANAAQKSALKKLRAEDLRIDVLAGENIEAILTNAPGNGAALGGLKVQTKNGWFAARPSGTEEIYKIYAESFRDAAHLAAIQQEAQAIVDSVFAAAHSAAAS